MGWLEANVPPLEQLKRPKASSADLQPWARDWQRRLFDAGWLVPGWPAELGGRDASPVEQMIYFEEMSRREIPRSLNPQGLGIIAPSIRDYGTDAQREPFLLPTLRAEIGWCLGMSEPTAGSDLASLRTRAVRDGDEFVVNGQKVWTSGAHFSDWGMMLVRTNWDVPKHQGITWIAVDMRSPGIEVRPLRQITGFAHFNEVFLTDVRIPASNVLGDVDNGWRIAQTTLGNERQMIGGGGSGVSFKSIAALAKASGRADDPLIRQELARSYTRFEILSWVGQRAKARAQAGHAPGPEMSIMKLAASQRVALDGDLGLMIEGADGMLAGTDAPDDGTFQQLFLNQWSIRIGGGTEQIQRNVIGERVLGLPGEPRPDKTEPFRTLPRN